MIFGDKEVGFKQFYSYMMGEVNQTLLENIRNMIIKTGVEECIIDLISKGFTEKTAYEIMTLSLYPQLKT